MDAVKVAEINPAKQRVLDVAEIHFMRRGYASVKLRDIADELGIRQASLYYHFPNGKEELYVEMVMNVFARHQLGMEAAIADAGPDLAQQLTAISHWFFIQPSINLSAMMHTDMPALSEESEARLTTGAFTHMFTPLRRAFEGAAEREEIRAINPNVLTGIFLAIMDSMEFSGHGPDTPSREEMVEDVISVLLHGVSADSQIV